MCGIHAAGVEILGVSASAITPTLTAAVVAVFLSLSLIIMRIDGRRGDR